MEAVALAVRATQAPEASGQEAWLARNRVCVCHCHRDHRSSPTRSTRRLTSDPYAALGSLAVKINSAPLKETSLTFSVAHAPWRHTVPPDCVDTSRTERPSLTV